MRARSRLRTATSRFLFMGLLLLGRSDPAAAQDKKDASLYDRLGGVYPIAVVVDDFIDRVMADATLNANPRIAEARRRAHKPGLKFQVAALVCSVTGGPQNYAGRSMKEAHAHLNITQKEWDALAADFKASLDQFKVPEKEQQELFAIVASTRKDIVVEQPESAGATPPQQSGAEAPHAAGLPGSVRGGTDTPPRSAIGAPPAPEKPEKIPEALQDTLYGRLGGVYPIADVIDDFVDRVGADETIKANPRVAEARKRVPPAGLKFQITALLCQVCGGPQKYAGRNMKDAHAHLGITEKEWEALAADLKAALAGFHVPEKEQKEILDIVESTKPDIVRADAPPARCACKHGCRCGHCKSGEACGCK